MCTPPRESVENKGVVSSQQRVNSWSANTKTFLHKRRRQDSRWTIVDWNLWKNVPEAFQRRVELAIR